MRTTKEFNLEGLTNYDGDLTGELVQINDQGLGYDTEYSHPSLRYQTQDKKELLPLKVLKDKFEPNSNGEEQRIVVVMNPNPNLTEPNGTRPAAEHIPASRLVLWDGPSQA